ncbi:MAG TPA: hypothetical protein VGA20_06170 [Gemmatimonadales bacterium]
MRADTDRAFQPFVFGSTIALLVTRGFGEAAVWVLLALLIGFCLPVAESVGERLAEWIAGGRR